MNLRMREILFAVALAAASTAALAANSAPQAVPLSQAVPAPADRPWPGGAIQLDVDASVTDDQLENMCKQLLANMVIENYRIERLAA